MKILIGDDHQLFRDGLRLQLMEFDKELEVVYAANFSEVFTRLEEAPDIELVLIDLGMPNMDWKDALKRLSEEFPTLLIIVVSGTDEQTIILKALDLGAQGYIPKSSSGEVMINALRLVLAGGVYLPQEVLLSHVKQPQTSEPRKGQTVHKLSPRQKEVLNLIASGKSNKQIADQLGLSDGTVKTHISAILKKLNTKNRTQAILEANRIGILQI